MSLKLVMAGVDSLHMSARGDVRKAVLDELELTRERAELTGEAVPFEFVTTSQAFLLKPHGLRGYRYWLASPDFELVVGKNERFPAVLVQLHSAYLHSCGIDEAVNQVGLLLRHDVFDAAPKVLVSRIDVYADFQGWNPKLTDLNRFLCDARHRRAFTQETFTNARQLTGFTFGKGSLVARLYDKSEETRKRGTTWLPALWGTVDPKRAVWRLEFQYRRPALKEFQASSVADVLAIVQDLWRYGTGDWLNLRRKTRSTYAFDWPIDPVWEQVRQMRISPYASGVVRKRIEEVNEETLVRGLMGYASSLGALRGKPILTDAMRDAAPLVASYLSRRSRTFEREVRRKQSRQMSVSALLDSDVNGGD